MDLKNEFEVIAYWYDPNIQPVAEYEKRFDAFVQVCEIERVKYIKGEYDVKNFFTKIKGLENTPER
jgi:predicted adenine nucleotide alpha hydrolase (AANH) superfamily ATPase